MKSNSLIQRREFLRTTTGALAATALTTGLMASGKASAAAPKAQVADVLKEIEARGEEFLSVTRKEAEFLNLLVKLTRARKVLELGTSQGYAAIWLTMGLVETGGQLTTVEIETVYMKRAKDHLSRAGLADRVTFHEGDAHKIVPTLNEVFDIVYLDADKTGLLDYFNSIHPGKLAPGGLLLAHNVIRQRADMEDYLEKVTTHPEYDSVTLSVSMEDGFLLSYRQR